MEVTNAIHRATYRYKQIALVCLLLLAVDAFLRIEGFLKAAGA